MKPNINENKTWPSPPSQPSVLPPAKPVYQKRSYLTHSLAGDLALGLVAGLVVHFLALVAFGVVAGIIGGIIARGHSMPLPLYYGSWGFTVVVSAVLVIVFFRRYPAYMTGFIISTVPVAAISLFIMWLGAGLAGGAAG